MYNYRRKELNKRPPEKLEATFIGRQIAVRVPFLRAKAAKSFMGTPLAESAYTWRRREAVN